MIAFLAPPNLVDSLLLKVFSQPTVSYVIWPLLQIVAIVTLVAFWALYATYAERKVSAFIQARLGPMRVGPYGLLQPIADAIKLLTKEDLAPDEADPYIFKFAPYISVFAAFVVLVVIPFAPDWGVITDLNIGILFVLAISSVGVLSLMLAGWSSNSKYPLIGALRSAAQMVSYEISMGLSIVGALMFARTLSLSGIVAAQESNSIWYFFYQPLGCVILLISGIAENNRAPFDLPEAESEIVAGFHTEYSGMRWSLFFMAEYCAMVVIAMLVVTLYFGGWYVPFVYRLTEARGYHVVYIVISFAAVVIKATFLLYLYFWLRWTLPRYRYDQLMDLGWKWLIPATLANIVLTATALFVVQAMDGWHGVRTIDSLATGLHLTKTGKGIVILFGWGGLLVTAALLAMINWRSRDFNLKTPRRGVRLLSLARGRPAFASAPRAALAGEPAAERPSEAKI